MRSVAALVVVGWASAASAYPWMIRHEYVNCTSCHVDPSGAGLLNEYGRAQQELLVTAHYGKKTDELEPQPGLLGGLIKLPAWLNAGASFRGALATFRPVPPGLLPPPVPASATFPFLMVADLRGEVLAGPVHAVVSVGFDPAGSNLAAIAKLNPEDRYHPDNIVSREHWLGVDLAQKAVMIRAGRLEVPFGLRNLEHPSWVRTDTRTDLLSFQQHGLAASFNTQSLRAELMGIAGNFQIPEEVRERGYSGSGELLVAPGLALGVSSKVTYAQIDLFTQQRGSVRQAHGLFGRWAIGEPVVLLAEADALVQSCSGAPVSAGLASFVQADWEPAGGVHLMATGESLYESPTPCAQTPGTATSFGGWLSVAYYFFSNAELRVDGILRQYNVLQVPGGVAPGPALTLIAQLHLSM